MHCYSESSFVIKMAATSAVLAGEDLNKLILHRLAGRNAVERDKYVGIVNASMYRCQENCF